MEVSRQVFSHRPLCAVTLHWRQPSCDVNCVDVIKGNNRVNVITAHCDVNKEVQLLRILSKYSDVTDTYTQTHTSGEPGCVCVDSEKSKNVCL